MSFRCRQRYKGAHCDSVIVQELVTLESGELVKESKDLTQEQMPDMELFDINNQLKAGIDLEEVNSKVMKSSKVDVDKVVRKYTTKKEVKNEK